MLGEHLEQGRRRSRSHCGRLGFLFRGEGNRRRAGARTRSDVAR